MDAAAGALLLVRADADPRIGAGHVMRALAIAQAWQDRGGVVRMMFAQPNPALERRLSDEGIDVGILGVERGSTGDVAAIVAEICRTAPAAVLVDGYDFGTGYLRQLQSGGRPVTLFDDYVQAPQLPVQVLVNQNLYANAADYTGVAPRGRLLLGPRYLALRREFRLAPRREQSGEEPTLRCVVTLGGGDIDNVTSRVLKALGRLDRSALEVVVLAGSQNPHLRELEGRVQSLGAGVRLEVDRRDMPSLLSGCDFAVCGAGATCWEMAYMGVATLPIILAANQERIGASITEHGIGASLGWHHVLTVERIATAVRDSLADRGRLVAMQRRARTLFDGHGAERVTDAAAMADAECASAGDIA